jgi:hypothetical protein
MRNRSLSEEQPAPVQQEAQQAAPKPAAPQQPQPAAAAQGPVVLTAVAPAWIRVSDQGKTLFEGMLQPGQTFQVPQTAAAPTLRAGAPEALRINVGQSVAPPVGPAGQVVDHVSLAPADLMRGPQPAAQEPAAQAPQNSLAQ